MKKTTQSFKFFLSFLGLMSMITLSGCNENLPDSKAIAIENKKRKIGRIKPLEIIEETGRLGHKILTETDSIWRTNVEKELLQNIDSIDSKGCKIYNTPYRTVALEEISVTKWGHRNIKSPELLAKEKELFEAYEYSKAQPTKGTYNLQKSGDSLLIYSQPITFDDKICLQCHSANKKGDFAGMLSARISKKKIVENIWLNK